VAALAGAVAAVHYLRLSSQLSGILYSHSEEWRQTITRTSNFNMRFVGPARRLELINLFDSRPNMLPSDPSVRLILRRARWAGWIVLIAFVVAVICLGAADAGSRYR